MGAHGVLGELEKFHYFQVFFAFHHVEFDDFALLLGESRQGLLHAFHQFGVFARVVVGKREHEGFGLPFLVLVKQV